jgi:plasmid stabilization system protein ParE
MTRITTLLAAGLVLLAAAALPTVRAGAQQPAVTDDNLDQMIASAKAPADHEAIAAYYEKEAADAKGKADLHRRAAESYRKLNLTKPPGMANMCDRVVGMWDKLAADASKLAKDHHEMAKNAGSETGH